MTKNGVLPVTALFFRKFCFSLRTSYKELFHVPTTQMPIFSLFLSAGVLFDGAFTLWVSLSIDIILTNSPKVCLKLQTSEFGLADLHKSMLTFLKIHYDSPRGVL